MPGIVVSRRDRLLLHLDSLERFRDAVEVPLAASQEGIAKRLGMQVHNVSRALKSLQTEGLVLERLAHVRGAVRRRRAYFLTTKGRNAVRDIISDILGKEVIVIDEGLTKEMTVARLEESVKASLGQRVSVPDLLDLLAGKESVAMDEIKSSLSLARTEAVYVERLHGMPLVTRFFGREAELGKIIDALKSSQRFVVVICGLPGIGKSTLAARVVSRLSGSYNLFWHRMREWDTPQTLARSLADFLSAIGRTSTAFELKKKGPMELFPYLQKDLTGSAAVLFVDDVHLAKDEALLFISGLADATLGSRSSRLVLISRRSLELFSVSAMGPGGWVLELELAGLDKEDALQLAKALNAKEAEKIGMISGGHPLTIELLAASDSVSLPLDISTFIEREIYSQLSSSEKEVLGYLSVFRHRVPFQMLQDLDMSCLSSLRRRSLISEADGNVEMHELVREFVYKHLDRAVRKKNHISAGRLCQLEEGSNWKLESLFHFIEAEDWKGAVEVLNASSPELLSDFTDESYNLISRIRLGTLSPSAKLDILFLRGQFLERLGKTSLALESYEEALSLAKGEKESEAQILTRIALAQSSIKMWEETFATHRKALKLYEESGNRDGQIRELINLGMTYRRKGRNAKAEKAYEKALELAGNSGNKVAKAAAFNNLALLRMDERDYGDAIELLKESITLARDGKDQLAEARALENLALVFRQRSMWDEAGAWMRAASEAYRKAGDVITAKKLLSDLALALSSRGKVDGALDVCRKSLADPALRRRPSLLHRERRFDRGDFDLSRVYGHLLWEKGDLSSALRSFRETVDIARKMEDDVLLSRSVMDLAMRLEEMGDLEKARELLHQVISLLDRIGDNEGLIAAHIRLGNVEEKSGRDGRAVEHYREAANRASLSKDDIAIAIGLESMGSLLGSDTEEGKKALSGAIEAYGRLGLKTEARRLKKILRDSQER